MSVEVVVLDTETTGLFRTDRVLEVAVVTIDLNRGVIDEWATLVNPMRDIPRKVTEIHGLTPRDVEAAPTFDEIAGTLAALLSGRVIAAHNLSFDARMLSQEYSRLAAGWEVPDGLCTMQAASSAGAPVRQLEACCRHFGVEIETAHAALCDARAAANLLLVLLDRHRGLRDQIEALAARAAPLPLAGLHTSQRTQQRSALVARRDPGYMTRLAARLPPHPELSREQNAYLSLLDDALNDFVITVEERRALADLAVEHGLCAEAVDKAHRVYLEDLIDAALRDGHVSGDERAQLEAVAESLGLEQRLETRLEVVKGGPVARLEPGTAVCFTGDAAVVVGGRAWTREVAHEIAREAGLVPREDVSKKTGVLVAGDPTSMSGKAQKARKLGIPVIGVREFLDQIGVK